MSELLDIIISAVDEASSVFESVSGAAQDMQSQLTSLTGSEMEDVASGADSAEAEIREADEAVQELDNDLSIINSSMILQLADQVGQLGSQAEGLAQDMNEAAISVGQLATQAGMAEPEMVNLINNISNATFPNDEAMMYVKSLDQIGVASENLGKSATDLDKINDAFGLGAETTNSLGQELSVLGVDMNNVSGSFNALAYANANTVGGMNNYYNFLRKYDAEFKDLGLNVDQASIIIAAATQKFGGGKAALTGLSNILKTTNGDLGAMEKELGLASGSLSNASEITGQYEGQLQSLASEEAEHKTLLDQLGAAWEDISLTLGSVMSPLMGVIGLIGSVGSFGLQVSGLQNLVSLIPKVTSAVRGFSMAQALSNAIEGEGAIARIASAVGITTEAAAAEGATVAFGGLAIAEGAALWPILAIAAAIAVLIAIVYEVGKAFGWWTDVGSMLEAIQSGIMRLWDAFINHPDVQAAISAISWALSTLWSWIQQAGQAILEFFGITTGGNFDIVRALIDSIGAAWNAITAPIRFVIGLVQQVIGVFDQFRNGQMDLPTFIMTLLTTLLNAYMSVFNAIINFVISIGSRLVSAGVSAARRLVTGMVNQLRQLRSRVRSALATVVTVIVTTIQSWINAAKNKALGIVNGVGSVLKGTYNSVTSALSNVKNAIVKPFQDAYNEAKKIWDNITSLGGVLSAGYDYLNGQNPDGSWNVNAAGYELPTPTNNTIIQNPVNETLDINHNIVLDFKDVPAGMDMDVLMKSFENPNFIRALVDNNIFQDIDARVKTRLEKKNGRARGY